MPFDRNKSKQLIDFALNSYLTLAGIYIHIPFCKQACHYCNFHFSTSLKGKNELIAALLRETELQEKYLGGEKVETIYIGGGTPSLLAVSDLQFQVEKIRKVFSVTDNAEVTLEANPDDITEEKLIGWKKAGINRLSIGIQSFFDEDLRWMNRAHSSKEATDSLQLAKKYFKNISIDLIYGYPLLSEEKWKQNVEKAVSFKIQHLSCYALTVEPKTPLQKMINRKEERGMDPDKQASHFLQLMDWLDDAGYEHYEISNFSLTGFRSGHNSSYWLGKKYLGLGPSAHSYDGISRQWNVSNNHKYIEAISKGIVPFEKEVLTPVQKKNEYIMTSLRTMEGLALNKVDKETAEILRARIRKYLQQGFVAESDNHIKLTKQGKLLADGIASDLFF